METPSSSTRRVTRSQTLGNNTNSLLSRESEKAMTKSRNQQQDRSALIDITNDSPIVGLAMGSLKTPSSAMSKRRVNGNQGQFIRTPGSGEDLLRGQVKNLLQKVEEEAEMSKITLDNRPFFNIQGLVKSPINILAPTPANTPQILNADCLPSVTPSPVIENFLIPQMMSEKKEESVESENVITRSLLLDFSEKSDSSECSSVVTYQGVVSGEREKVGTDDDDSSIWSIQVNASSNRDEEEDEEVEVVEEDDDYYYGEEEEEEDDNGLVDELCEGISKISVEEGTKFMGKHIRFMYNSDDEIQEEEEIVSAEEEDGSTSRGAMRLKGLPTPKGKHLRFPEESEDDN